MRIENTERPTAKGGDIELNVPLSWSRGQIKEDGMPANFIPSYRAVNDFMMLDFEYGDTVKDYRYHGEPSVPNNPKGTSIDDIPDVFLVRKKANKIVPTTQFFRSVIVDNWIDNDHQLDFQSWDSFIVSEFLYRKTLLKDRDEIELLKRHADMDWDVAFKVATDRGNTTNEGIKANVIKPLDRYIIDTLQSMQREGDADAVWYAKHSLDDFMYSRWQEDIFTFLPNPDPEFEQKVKERIRISFEDVKDPKRLAAAKKAMARGSVHDA